MKLTIASIAAVGVASVLAGCGALRAHRSGVYTNSAVRTQAAPRDEFDDKIERNEAKPRDVGDVLERALRRMERHLRRRGLLEQCWVREMAGRCWARCGCH